MDDSASIPVPACPECAHPRERIVVPTSLGAIVALEAETGAALAGAHGEVEAVVRAAPVKNVDESGWIEGGRKRWLWTAATATSALFVIHPRRSFAGLQALPGEAIAGVARGDRWAVYGKLPLGRRQFCWAHLKRDFRKLVDRGGPADAIGRAAWRSWNASSPTGGRSAAAKSTGRPCKPGRGRRRGKRR